MRDVIVIGAGGGGPVVAKELAARGLDVLLLEAGSRFLHPEKEWSRLEYDCNEPTQGYFRVGPSDRSKAAWLRETPQHCYIWQVSGVGGTTLHYYGNNPRALPGVFRGYNKRDRNAYDRTYEFPFSYRSFVPYYEWMEHTLPVQTAAMGTKEQVFLRGARRIGLPVQKTKDTTRDACRPQENAILQPRGTAGRTSDPAKLRHPQARGCTFCGFCFQGCIEPRGAPRNLTAKRSTDNSYVPMALTADAWHAGGRAATLIADAFVTQIRAERRGETMEARGVTWRDTNSGDMHTEDAKVVVMAGGCIENPRLWLNSGLPNPNDWVGRGGTDHHFDWVIGQLPFYTGSSKGPGSGARCDYPGRGGLENVGLPPGIQAFSANLGDAGIAGLTDNGSKLGKVGADTLGRIAGNQFRELMTNIDHLLNILVITDDDVDARNRVSLSAQMPPDAHGPVPKVEFSQRARSARTFRNREFLAGEAVKLLRSLGARSVHRIGWAPLILHIQSTMRMGSNPRNSVLDETCEARFVKRLYIADHSALPNGLGGPNPTISSQALATRTAENIFVKYFGGDRWVGRESPLVSTDRRVTNAVIERGL